MANANAQTHDIDLASPNLNLDKYKLGVSQFDGFNYRNSPFISHEIKNLYTKQNTADVFIDEDNNEYKLDGYNFKKNGETIRTFKNDSVRTTFFDVSELQDFEYDINHHKAKIINQGNSSKLGYANGSIYYKRQSETIYNYLPYELYSIDNIIDSMYVTKDDVCWLVYVGTLRTNLSQHIYVARISGNDEERSFHSIDCGQYYEQDEYILCGYLYNYTKLDDTEAYDKLKKSCCLWHNRQGRDGLYLDPNSSYLILFDVLPTEYLSQFNLSKFEINAYDGDNVRNIIFTNCTSFVGDKHGLVLVRNIDTLAIHNISSDSIFVKGVCFTPRYMHYELREYSPNIFSQVAVFECDDNYAGFNSTYIKGDGTVSASIFSPVVDNPVYQHSKWLTQFAFFRGQANDKQFYASMCSSYLDTGLSMAWFPTQEIFTLGGQSTFSSVDESDNKTIFRILFNSSSGSFVVSSVSVADKYDNIGAIVFPFDTVDDIIDIQNNFYSEDNLTDVCLIIKANNNKLYKLNIISPNDYNNKNKFSVIENRYIVFLTSEYYNTYDLNTNKWLHAASDFNFTVGFSRANNSVFYGVLRNKQSSVAAAVSAFYELDKNPFPSMQRQSKFVNNFLYYTYNDKHIIPLLNTATRKPINSNYINYDVDIFYHAGSDNVVPEYMASGYRNHFKSLYEAGLNYINTEGNLLYPMPLCVKSDNLQVPMIYNEDIGFNAPIHIEKGSPTGLYFLLAAQIDAEYYFTIQSALYCIIDDWICSYTYNNGIADNIKRVANVYGLDFLCATPLSAFFWSRYNKTIYQFQGDALLHRGQCIDEIEHIYQVKYNSATNDIIMCCDAYTIILSEQYAFKVANETKTVSGQTVEIPYTDVFWTNTDLCLRNTDHILMIRYNAAQLPYRKQNIIVKTQLYGLGDNMLSETDCVFIRVFNAENETGSQTVKVGGFTLTDKRSDLTTREYIINQNDWTDDGSYYIRYQPTYQKALGIQIEIESTVPITYIGVSNIPDTKMITKL